MKVAVEKQEKHLASINLEIPAEHASQEYHKACKRIGQRLNIPGFRRGKAPRAMIEKTVGVERIKQEALDRLLPHAFADVISEHQLEIVAPPQVETCKFDLNEGITVKAQVELRPDVELPDMTSVTAEVTKFVTPEGAEERELKAIVERMTTLEPVIDRAVMETDIVQIDFTGSVNGELIRGGAAKNYRLDIADNNFIEGFAAQIVGHKLSEEFTIKVTFPKEYHDTQLSGKPAEFLIKINEINKKVVPTLTDELAKKVGPYESMAHLKEQIQAFLKQNEEQENTFRKQRAIIDAVVEKAQLEVPDSMINREAKLLMEEIQQRFQGQGVSWEQFLDSQGHESIWDNLRQEAVKRIKTSLVFGAIAKNHNIRVTEDEFSEQVRDLAHTRNVDEKAIMRQLANHTASAQALSDQILSQKIVDILMGNAKFIWVDEKPEAEESPKEETSEAKPAAQVAPADPALEGEEFEVLQDE